MKVYFDEETDKRLLEAQTEEEVKAIIADTPEAEKLADKTDLVMAELARIKGSVDNELDLDELDSAAGGAKLQDVYLSESQSCIATFFLEDLVMTRVGLGYCWSNDFCSVSNEYCYHYSRYSNCKKGGKHEWVPGVYSETLVVDGGVTHEDSRGFKCSKCDITIFREEHNFNS